MKKSPQSIANLMAEAATKKIRGAQTPKSADCDLEESQEDCKHEKGEAKKKKEKAERK